jgi:hypothetical protein
MTSYAGQVANHQLLQNAGQPSDLLSNRNSPAVSHPECCSREEQPLLVLRVEDV